MLSLPLSTSAAGDGNGGDVMQSNVEVITPELARDWLLLNTKTAR